jgi:hypothetical protein
MRLRVALILVAIAAALGPTPPRAVEELYSAGVYSAVQPSVTSVSNLVPFALLDPLAGLVLAAWLALAADDLVRLRRIVGWRRAFGHIVMRTGTWSAALYLVFVAMWGLNYRRVPLAEKLQFDEAAVNTDRAAQLDAEAVNALNALYAPAHTLGWDRENGETTLAAGFADAIRDVGVTADIVTSRPKRSLFNWYFQRAGVQGMIDPYFLETLVASDLLPFERPFVFAHEWSHLAGFADESEANFVGWLACLRASDAERYSGWLFLYEELAGSLTARDRTALASRLAAGPRGDLRAIAARVQRQVDPRTAAVGWQVYDRYLKANRVQEGVASYAQVVRLVLGVRFSSDWRPQSRQPGDQPGPWQPRDP